MGFATQMTSKYGASSEYTARVWAKEPGLRVIPFRLAHSYSWHSPETTSVRGLGLGISWGFQSDFCDQAHNVAREMSDCCKAERGV